MNKTRRQTGFTLMEVMITVAIIGILAAVALPSYQDYVRKGSIPEGLAALSDLRIKMEGYYQDNRNYGDAGVCANLSTAAWAKFEVPAGAKFTLDCVPGGNGQRYTVTVKGASGTTVVGHHYTIDQDNVRKTIKFKGEAVDKSCWLIKGDEC